MKWFISRSSLPLFWGILASFTVFQNTQCLPTSPTQSGPMTLNQTIGLLSSYAKFLKEWKTLYSSQKEILLSILNYERPEILRDLKVTKDVDLYNYLIDVSLFQMNKLEDIRSQSQNVALRDSLVQHVRKVIHRNQNPKECRDIEVIAYDPQSICGFGCQIHHIAYCLTTALGEGKPLLVKASPWHNFDSIFDLIMPLSENCHYDMIETHNLTAKHIRLKYEYHVAEFLPPIYPENIGELIDEFSTEPFVWYIAQIIMYILRFRPNMMNHVKPIELPSPIVGVHVRRTDKLWGEAKCYRIEEYMKYVELYYRKLEQKSKVSTKNVYLATDDQQIIDEFRQKYPDYNFITSNVEYTADRFSHPGTFSILSDIYHLAKSDHLVCTFSSNICRLAYEWMNGQKADGTEDYYSVDDIYFYARQKDSTYSLHLDHTAGDRLIDTKARVYLITTLFERYRTVRFADTPDEYKVPGYKLRENPMYKNFKAFENMEL
ncbi:Alpha-(1,6)-fucosyltransferase [Thelohanellus kitauei]|uniref:Alpha-(1,6)-fucosyltransferase n=1 Tax=Thelohanellus kitauei TaxID=669202 RepID=A0A0C2MQ34_THEKT|nr:Alpha-(1,6)-fucosyltransferase [Thelohanellus kitauei]